MNRHLYRLIFNQRLGALVPVSENCPALGKGSAVFPGLALLAALLGLSPLTQANPTAPVVMSGSADFSQSGNTLTISNSPNAIIHWGGFSIGHNELTRFVQQSSASAVLNRVVGQDPSHLLGQLQSNGRVFLINPNGVIFAAGARIDTAGLIASSLRFSNEDFLAGRLKFTGNGTEGAVRNAGNITTPSGGQVVLIAPDVENSGVITSPQGEIILAAGHTVELLDTSNPALRVEISAPAGRALNLGSLIAAGGHIGMAASLVQQSGHLNAGSAVAEGGRIFLKATNTATLTQDSITEAQGSQGGEITIRSGEATRVEQGALIQANAHESGRGGRVVVWSDKHTQFHGDIEARGGSQGGDGGFAEVSGRETLEVTGHADLSAPQGEAGEMLLDPGSITISSAASNAAAGLLNATWVNNQLANSDLTLATTSSTLSNNGASEDIIVNAPLAWTTTHTLTLEAGRNITLNRSITAGNGGRLSLNPGQSVSGGSTHIGASLTISGNWDIANGLTLANGVTLTAGSSALYFTGSGAQTISVLSGPAGSAGAATLNLEGGNIYAYDSDQDLTLGSGLTVNGWGSLLVYTTNSKLINNGTLDANAVNGTLTTYNYDGEIINNGTIKSSRGNFHGSAKSLSNSGSILALAGTTTITSPDSTLWTNQGVIEVQTDATFSTANRDLLNLGTIRGNGSLDLGSSYTDGTPPDNIPALTLNTLTNRGTLDPGMGAGGLGRLRIKGNLDLEADGSVHIDLGGTGLGQYDQIAVLGTTQGDTQTRATGTLAGRMEIVEASNGYHAGLVDTFPNLITADGGLSGNISTVSQRDQDVVFNLSQTGSVGITNISTSITRWLTDSSGDWGVAANWSRGIPSAHIDAVTSRNGASPVITISSGSNAVRSLNSDARIILSGGRFTLPQDYVLQGSLDISGGTLVNPSDLILSGGTLINADHLALSGNTQWHSGTVRGTGSITLVNGASLTKSGSGLLDLQQAIYNNGTLTLSNSTFSSTITNTATSTMNLGAGLTFTQPFSNRGNMNLLAGTAIFQKGLTQFSGLTTLAGGNLQGNLDLQGGSLSGSGNLSGNLTLSGQSTLTPGHSPGTIQISGNLQLAPTSNLLIELGASQHDLLDVQGSASLNGTLTVVELNGNSPSINTTFTPITAAGGISGTFVNETLPSAAYRSAYHPQALELVFSTSATENRPPFVEQFLALAQAGLVNLIGVGIPEDLAVGMDSETPRFTLTAPGPRRIAITPTPQTGTYLTEVDSLAELTTLVTELLEQANNEEWDDESRLVCR